QSPTFSSQHAHPHPDLPSFPTRRSSDLATTAAAVSSQEDSIPRMRVLIKFPFCSLQFQILQVVSEVTAKFFILQANFHGRFQKPDRKSTRLSSSHQIISYAVFCLKKKKN